MAGKVIEKAFKYTIPTPNELFQIFQEKFSKATLPDSWEVSQPWTNTILNIFGEIGRSLGYIPRKEYLRLDQTWEIRHPDISTIVLALEYENTDDVREILDDELQKLLDIKAFFKSSHFLSYCSSNDGKRGIHLSRNSRKDMVCKNQESR